MFQLSWTLRVCLSTWYDNAKCLSDSNKTQLSVALSWTCRGGVTVTVPDPDTLYTPLAELYTRVHAVGIGQSNCEHVNITRAIISEETVIKIQDLK